ncbi:MAG: glutamate racemase [Thermodesulfovibrionales bacterium]|nr:glutamate racemase [Thermodesulfovibrionales bacterium]
MKKSDFPIGIFDSGIGGLTVLKEICKVLPYENIVYFGDTARVPYGIRSPETVTKYALECIRYLLNHKIKLLVVACNTASAISLKDIRENVKIPVVGVIEPGAKAAITITKNKKIGVIGTEATVKSGAYRKAITEFLPQAEVFELACPLFVPLVEEGWTDDIIAYLIAEKYLKSMINKAVDTLVLGCTHYPLIKNVIQKIMGTVCLVDSAIETSLTVSKILNDNNLLKDNSISVNKKFFVTDSPDKFIAVGERFLNDKIINIERIAL